MPGAKREGRLRPGRRSIEAILDAEIDQSKKGTKLTPDIPEALPKGTRLTPRLPEALPKGTRLTPRLPEALPKGTRLTPRRKPTAIPRGRRLRPAPPPRRRGPRMQRPAPPPRKPTPRVIQPPKLPLVRPGATGKRLKPPAAPPPPPPPKKQTGPAISRRGPWQDTTVFSGVFDVNGFEGPFEDALGAEYKGNGRIWMAKREVPFYALPGGPTRPNQRMLKNPDGSDAVARFWLPQLDLSGSFDPVESGTMYQDSWPEVGEQEGYTGWERSTHTEAGPAWPKLDDIYGGPSWFFVKDFRCDSPWSPRRTEWQPPLDPTWLQGNGFYETGPECWGQGVREETRWWFGSSFNWAAENPSVRAYPWVAINMFMGGTRSMGWTSAPADIYRLDHSLIKDFGFPGVLPPLAYLNQNWLDDISLGRKGWPRLMTKEGYFDSDGFAAMLNGNYPFLEDWLRVIQGERANAMGAIWYDMPAPAPGRIPITPGISPAERARQENARRELENERLRKIEEERIERERNRPLPEPDPFPDPGLDPLVPGVDLLPGPDPLLPGPDPYVPAPGSDLPPLLPGWDPASGAGPGADYLTEEQLDAELAIDLELIWIMAHLDDRAYAQFELEAGPIYLAYLFDLVDIILEFDGAGWFELEAA